jgi:hypothetical protein
MVSELSEHPRQTQDSWACQPPDLILLGAAVCLSGLLGSCYYDFGSLETNSESNSDHSTHDNDTESDSPTSTSSESHSSSETDTWQTDTNTDTSTDLCPADPNKTEPGWCGCGQPEGTCPGIAVSQLIYNVEDSIVVQYWSLSGNMLDWVGIFQTSEEHDNWDSFAFILGQTEGTLVFVGLPPGQYEARLFFNDNYTVMDTVSFSVVPKNTEVLSECNADAYVDQSTPLNNYGASENLFVSSEPLRQSFFRFTVPPLAAPIERILFRVMLDFENVLNGPKLFLADNEWVENEVNWNSRPSQGEIGIADFDRLSAHSWSEISITGHIPNAGTYTIALAPDGTESVGFYSREAKWKPYLVIVMAE